MMDEKYKLIRDMLRYVKKAELPFYLFMDYCSVVRHDWFKILCDNESVVIMVTEVIKENGGR